MLNYPFDFEKIKAIFLERKNRFVIIAKVKGKKFNCYLPNPGRLWELLIPYETELILIKNENSEKLPFTVLFCKKNDNWVLLHTHVTNKIIKDLINNNLISFYKGYKVIAEEIKVNNSRFDLMLQKKNKKIYLEIKTCTLFGREVAMFPDAVTLRGKRHLWELSKLKSKDISSEVLFVVMNPEVNFFLPAYSIDFEFAKTFIEVKDSVDLKAIALEWDNSFSYVKAVKELIIPFLFVKEVLHDRGVYVLVTYLNESKLIRIGKLREENFSSGYYVYVGKAKKGLFKRIWRHKRINKKMHWHIDYLLSKVKIIKDLPIVTDKDIECTIAERLSKISDGVIFSFGSSDCKCNTHLFYFKENPILKRDFIEIITYFRLDFIEI